MDFANFKFSDFWVEIYFESHEKKIYFALWSLLMSLK